MKNKGVVETVILYYVIAFMALLFVPNPVSNAVGIGNRQNKIVQTDKVTLINDEKGMPIAYRQVTNQSDLQQHVTFWEWLKSLPVFVLFLMIMGLIFPPVALVLARLWAALKKETRKIVVGVDQAMKEVSDPALKEKMYDKMDGVQNDSTKKLVDKIQGK